MRGQLGTLLPRQTSRQRSGNRAAALRYAAWGWPIAPNAALPATADLEQVFAAWTRLPEAPILAACGVAFDVIEADAAAARTALARLDRLGVEVGPVTVGPAAGSDSQPGRGSRAGAVGGPTRIGFLVRAGSAAALSPLIAPRSGPVLIGAGAHFELPRAVDPASPRASVTAVSDRRWLRVPDTARPALPAAHGVLGALALVPYRALAATPLGR
jgi:hypothetical protein